MDEHEWTRTTVAVRINSGQDQEKASENSPVGGTNVKNCNLIG